MKRAFDLTLQASHPVVAQHRVHGQRVLPGLAYIDLLMAIARDGLHIDGFAAELRDLVIYRPLLVEEGGEVRLTITVTGPEDGVYSIEVAPEGAAGDRYCAAELRPSLAGPEPDLDLAALEAAPRQRLDLDELYAQARGRGLLHEGLMRADGVARRFDWGCLIELRVPAEHRSLLADAVFHPTLIDGAAVASSILESALPATDGEQALYLPLHYGAFRARAPLNGACVARVRLDRIEITNDIRKLDIDFYDEAGRWVATLAELTGKRVRERLDARRAVPAGTSLPRAASAADAQPGAADASAFERGVLEIFARHLGVGERQLDTRRGFFDMGLSSSQMLTILKDVEGLLTRRLNPTLLFEHNTIEELLEHLRGSAPAAVQAVPGERSAIRPADAARYRFEAGEPQLADHLVDGKPALMGITYPCLALHARGEAAPRPFGLRDVRFSGGPLTLGADQGVDIEIRFDGADGMEGFEARQRVDGATEWSPCCDGRIVSADGAEPPALDWQALQARGRELSADEIARWYEAVPAFGIGPALRSIRRAFELDDGTLVSEVDLTDKRHALELPLDPLLLNVCYQFDAEGINGQDAFVPLLIENLTLWRPMTSRAVVAAKPRRVNPDFIALDATLYDDALRCVATVKNASLRRLAKPAARAGNRAGGRGAAVAVVGMAGRFPQARDLDAFWNNLREGRDCITEIPAERWDWREYYSPGREPGTISSKWGGFIEEADAFDPLFFQISPREAEVMDPLERLFLQHCWMAMEDAGYTRDALRAARSDGSAGGRVGIYAGVMGQEYPLFALEASERMGLGGGTSSVASRMSYVCDFNGPAMAVDTMCSSSLVAIGMACEALASGAVDAAFAGGANLSLHPSKYLMLSRGQFISSKGHCESFGEGGDGYIPGEGVGALMLKRLDDAERDGDMIHGVIRAVEVNHGGRASGYTVPNPAAQARAIRGAIQRAGVAPADISYVEAHGTGTKLGDPVEIAGLTRAFADAGPALPAGACRIGSVKSNIGHCEGAAGVAGMLKVLLQMRHQAIAPSLHSSALNPAIDFAATPFTVNQALTPWPAIGADGAERLRVAGLSSFGAGGVNAHAIIEAYPMPAVVRRANAGAGWLIVLSARERSRLPIMAANLLAAIERRLLDDDALPSLAYTLQVGREAMEHRAATIVRSIDELKDRLRAFPADARGGGDWHGGAASENRDAVRLYADDDAQALLQAWLDKENLHALAQAWAMGVEPDWRRLYRPEAGYAALPRRMSLPSYPFKTERYWIAGSGSATARAAEVKPVQTQAPAADERRAELFAMEWRPCARQDGDAEGDAARGGFILVLATAATRALAERVAALRPGTRIADIDRLENEAERLCKPNGHALASVLDLTALDPAHARGLAARVDGWLPGMQRLVEQVRLNGARLLAVTRHLEAFARPESAEPLPHAALTACLYRSLGFEYARLESGHLDIDLSDDAAELPRQMLARLEGREILPRVCIRGGQAYAPHFAPLQAEANARPFSFPAEHALWITGGTRGLGLLCARHMVARHGVRLIALSGRERLPAAERWADILANPGDAAVSASAREKIAAIVELQRFGAKVLALDVDLSDERAMAGARERIVRELGPIGGVIHCAGMGDANPAWIRKNPSGVRAVFAPKTAGLDGLCRAVSGQPLSLFVVYSSVCAALPGLAAGQIDYAMANAYMDALAEHEPGLGIVSLQWPSWIETGMGAMETDVYRATGLAGLTDRDGLALLDRALAARGRAVMMPALVDPARWRAEIEPARQAEPRPEAGKPSAAPATKPAAVDAAALSGRAQAWLGGLFMAELKIAPADFDARVDFSNYGLDSILMAQILRTINVELKVDLAPSLILEQPNLAALCAWLLANEGAALAAYFSSGPQEAEPAAVAEAYRQAEPAPQAAALAAAPAAPVAGERPDDIVVVGMSARFPGAADLDSYWRLLSEGRSAFSRSPGRAGFVGSLGHGGRFDRETFHIPIEDFNAMDPQALMVLEECLNLWAHAGYRPEEVKGGATGVFLGGRARASLDPEALHAARNPIVVAGQNYLAANVSHFFDLSGPSLVLDAACSSALVGMHLASQALRSGEIDSAIVGGIHLHDAERTHAVFERRGLLSAGDSFHLFDERADGIILSEGVGLVLLKTAAQARRDGDTVYARIAALSCNNDGRTAGPATPNLERQTALMRRVLAKSGLNAGDITHIETNGSGTKVTDLLELKAINAVYGRLSGGEARRQSCALGSIKPNIGHPLCAEGIASFIKAVLMLHHNRLTPFLSGQQGLRHFDLDASPFYFPREAELPPRDQPLTVAINCFADGGTNAHAILQRAEEPVAAPAHAPLARPELRRQAQAVRAPGMASIEPVRARDKRAPHPRATTMIWEQYQ
ncbi:hypothetical protein DK842_05870 [Chromobacterium phragmitis]|uniref:beta-ketoacyl synthase N-terminal-like domain-containing protein n=1 Tax=Chromobacterium phragmitis TaxID=2202141 RepID=UPI000DEC2C9D|nr:beta-ketoacyl synthase N-terminal-like domain-containing protein [Chromobacterium phragmitis]AXE29469.1 hypothetical protein DK842_05870 [Chromobacterium phragmitis]